jgi:TolB-like protein
VVEEIIPALPRFKSLFVIARNSAIYESEKAIYESEKMADRAAALNSNSFLA